MIKFGYIYIQGKMVVYDISVDTSAGYKTYVAAISESPEINFRAVRAETAVLRMMEYLESRPKLPTLERVTWMPTQVKLPSRTAARPY